LFSTIAWLSEESKGHVELRLIPNTLAVCLIMTTMMMMHCSCFDMLQADDVMDKPSLKLGGWGADAEYESRLNKFIFRISFASLLLHNFSACVAVFLHIYFLEFVLYMIQMIPI